MNEKRPKKSEQKNVEEDFTTESHEEFIDNTQPSITKKEYESGKKQKPAPERDEPDRKD